MRQTHFSICFLILLFIVADYVQFQAGATDASVMQDLKKSLNVPNSLGWSDSDFCNWSHVECSDGQVVRIQIGQQGLSGTLPASLNKLQSLSIFEVFRNQITGPLPSFSGLKSMNRIMLNDNNFSSIPPDFFQGMTALQDVYLENNPFSSWVIPDSLKSASTLQTFSATATNLSGAIPEFLGNFPSLKTLHLAFNYLEGSLPLSFRGSSIQSLWLNGQKSDSRLNGSIDVISNMTSLTQVWLHSNSFTGPLPDFSGLSGLNDLSLRDNRFTGPVPDSLLQLSSLNTVNLTNNYLQGPTPKFSNSVSVDMAPGLNSFCSDQPGAPCDSSTTSLLAVAQGFDYPYQFASKWKGDDPCKESWPGVTCNNNGNITVLNFPNLNLFGVISPKFSAIGSLEKLILSNNNLTGRIPDELTTLPHLQLLDVSNNQLYGTIPAFNKNVLVKTDGNPGIGNNNPPPGTPPPGTPPPGTPPPGTPPPGTPPSGTPRTPSGNTPPSDITPGSPSESMPGASDSGKKFPTGVVAGSVGGLAAIVSAGLVVFLMCGKKSKNSSREQAPNAMVVHPRRSGSDQETVKITVSGESANGMASETFSVGSSGTHVVETENMVISIQFLRGITNNFSAEKILGKGGFGTVYKGDLHDGTKMAVKRMESGVLTEKGLDEFKSEIAIVTKVRHRHLVALRGYCIDGNERILVYEYMPQGTLSRYLFHWEDEGLKPLEWTQRIVIALDVARGVEYLHGLAQQSFIHRDLKPSNILLGDNLRAKVADFGLIRLVPDGKATVVTRLAGTFGYLAPEYAVLGRATTKIDVFSFGVILMELITGRKALDESKPEESVHLAPWFRRMQLDKQTFKKAIDPTIELTEETLASLNTVAELAGHCCASEPHQRPDMNHAVNVLSSLVEMWKPVETDPDDIFGIDYDMTLPQALKKWQAFEGMSGSSYLTSGDNSQTSIPTRPSGFVDSFRSGDGR